MSSRSASTSELLEFAAVPAPRGGVGSGAFDRGRGAGVGELGLQHVDIGMDQIGVDQARARAFEDRELAPGGGLIGMHAQGQHPDPVDRRGTVEFLVMEQRIEAGRGTAGGGGQAPDRGDGVGEIGGRSQPARGLQQHLGAVTGQFDRGGRVAREDDADTVHPRGEGLGRVVEDLVGRAVAQRFGVEHVGQRGEIGRGRAAALGVDPTQDGDADGEETQQPVVVENGHPRFEHDRATGGDRAQRTLVGRGDHHLGAAAQRTVDGVDQPRVARVVAGHQDHVQRTDPRRQRGDGHDRQPGPVAERGDEQSGRARGATRSRDQHQAARAQVGEPFDERGFGDRRRGGTDLRAARGRRAQGAAGVGRRQRLGIVEVEYRCSSDHRRIHLPSSRCVVCDSTIPAGHRQCS